MITDNTTVTNVVLLTSGPTEFSDVLSGPKYGSTADTKGLLQRAHVIAGEIRYVGKETDRKWEEGEEISVLEFTGTDLLNCSFYFFARNHFSFSPILRESTSVLAKVFDRKNFIRKLVRDLPVKRNSYNEFVRLLQDNED